MLCDFVRCQLLHENNALTPDKFTDFTSKNKIHVVAHGSGHSFVSIHILIQLLCLFKITIRKAQGIATLNNATKYPEEKGTFLIRNHIITSKR